MVDKVIQYKDIGLVPNLEAAYIDHVETAPHGALLFGYSEVTVAGVTYGVRNIQLAEPEVKRLLNLVTDPTDPLKLFNNFLDSPAQNITDFFADKFRPTKDSKKAILYTVAKSPNLLNALIAKLGEQNKLDFLAEIIKKYDVDFIDSLSDEQCNALWKQAEFKTFLDQNEKQKWARQLTIRVRTLNIDTFDNTDLVADVELFNAIAAKGYNNSAVTLTLYNLINSQLVEKNFQPLLEKGEIRTAAGHKLDHVPLSPDQVASLGLPNTLMGNTQSTNLLSLLINQTDWNTFMGILNNEISSLCNNLTDAQIEKLLAKFALNFQTHIKDNLNQSHFARLYARVLLLNGDPLIGHPKKVLEHVIDLQKADPHLEESSDLDDSNDPTKYLEEKQFIASLFLGKASLHQKLPGFRNKRKNVDGIAIPLAEDRLKRLAAITKEAHEKHRNKHIRFLFSFGGWRSATRSLMRLYKFLALKNMGSQIDDLHDVVKDKPIDSHEKLLEFLFQLLENFHHFDRMVEAKLQEKFDEINQYEEILKQQELASIRNEYKHLVNRFFRSMGLDSPIHNQQKKDASLQTKYEILPVDTENKYLNDEDLREKQNRSRAKTVLKIIGMVVTVLVALGEGAVAMVFAIATAGVGPIFAAAIGLAGIVANAILFKKPCEKTLQAFTIDFKNFLKDEKGVPATGAKKAIAISVTVLAFAGGVVFGFFAIHSMVTAILLIAGMTALLASPPGWVLALAIITAVAVTVALTSLFYCIMKFFVINEKHKELWAALKRAFLPRPGEAIAHHIGRVIVNGIFMAIALALFVGLTLVTFGLAIDKGFAALNIIMHVPAYIATIAAKVIGIVGTIANLAFYFEGLVTFAFVLKDFVVKTVPDAAKSVWNACVDKIIHIGNKLHQDLSCKPAPNANPALTFVKAIGAAILLPLLGMIGLNAYGQAGTPNVFGAVGRGGGSAFGNGGSAVGVVTARTVPEKEVVKVVDFQNKRVKNGAMYQPAHNVQNAGANHDSSDEERETASLIRKSGTN